MKSLLNQIKELIIKHIIRKHFHIALSILRETDVILDAPVRVVVDGAGAPALVEVLAFNPHLEIALIRCPKSGREYWVSEGTLQVIE